MGKSLSPILRKELENLGKDADSRKSAMKALKSYVKDLDSKAIPVFLAQVSETKQAGITTGEHTISLYEVLARVHGPKIVPQIKNIMNTIIKTLSLSAGAFALHQACSKVVPAISRYAIDPTTAEDRKRYIIHSLCKPLSDCLLGSQENLSSGAALCLQALVESDNWRFNSNEMVNEVCQKVAGALEKHSQTNSHMALVTALAKHNSLIVEAYARLLIHSGLKILDTGFMEASSQKQLSAIHMVSSLLRCLDPRSIISEIELVIKEMERCQYDRMPFVTGAAFEVLQIAKKICSDKCSKLERDVGSANGSNFSKREKMRTTNVCSSGDQSPFTASPESQTIESFSGYDSPTSLNHGHKNADSSRTSVNRRLWRRCDNGVLDVSLRDGIFSVINKGGELMSYESDETCQNHEEYFENFAGFVQESEANRIMSSSTPSPQRLNSHINVDDVKIFTTPRKLIHSLQDLDDYDTPLLEKQSRRFRNSMTDSSAWTSACFHGQNGLPQEMRCEKSKNILSSGSEWILGGSESVSSTDDMLNNKDLDEIVPANKSPLKTHHKATRRVVCGLLVSLFAAFLFLLAIGDQEDHNIIVPT